MSSDPKTILQSFILDIIKVFPEYEKRLTKSYLNILKDEEKGEELISDFFENIDEISKSLSENDFSIFESDPIIVNNVSFKLIWNSDISNETKNNIWRYLQTLCICNINSKQGEGEVQDVLNSIKQNEKVSDKGTLKNIKLLKKLSESLNLNTSLDLLSDPKSEETKSLKIDGQKMKGMGEMKGMEDILENSSIGKIAKEVSEELDIESMLGEGGGIENLMNGENMMNIFKSISDKIDNNEGGNIMEEAMDLSKNMQDNPLFSSLMSTMGQGLSKMNGPIPQQQNYNRTINFSNNHDGSATKKRLQKKLQERDGKVDVNKKE
jgi:hypothetical protein